MTDRPSDNNRNLSQQNHEGKHHNSEISTGANVVREDKTGTVIGERPETLGEDKNIASSVARNSDTRRDHSDDQIPKDNLDIDDLMPN